MEKNSPWLSRWNQPNLISLPETNSLPLKIGLPNRKVFQPSICRGELLVLGRVAQPRFFLSGCLYGAQCWFNEPHAGHAQQGVISAIDSIVTFKHWSFFGSWDSGSEICWTFNIWVFPKIRGTPQNGWFISWKTLLKWMIWRYPYFWKHPYIQVFFSGPPQKKINSSLFFLACWSYSKKKHCAVENFMIKHKWNGQHFVFNHLMGNGCHIGSHRLMISWGHPRSAVKNTGQSCL